MGTIPGIFSQLLRGHGTSLLGNELTATELRKSPPLPDRPGFRKDPNISTGSASASDYTHTGYDRGHLMRAEFSYSSGTAYRQSFYMSNICPQLPRFNRAGQEWYDLEQKEKQLASTLPAHT